MKREILFRAQRVDNNEWVEGYYYPMFQDDSEAFILSKNDGIVYQVIPESVCQFTGLTDKNGTKIFEGDIIHVTEYKNEFMKESMEFRNSFELNDLKGEVMKDYISEVKYEDCAFIMNDSHISTTCLSSLCGDMKHSYPIFEFEVIGNIFDLHEILK